MLRHHHDVVLFGRQPRGHQQIVLPQVEDDETRTTHVGDGVQSSPLDNAPLRRHDEEEAGLTHVPAAAVRIIGRAVCTVDIVAVLGVRAFAQFCQ